MQLNQRTFLMLAHKYIPARHNLQGWFASQKWDGVRAFWDGGVTRGLLASEVPWANIDKDGRYKVAPTATGLWTRYGKTIQAPADWLDALPRMPLDGELWVGHGQFQRTTSIVSRIDPSPTDWNDVKYMLFDRPAYEHVLRDGYIREPHYEKIFRGFDKWALERASKLGILEVDPSYCWEQNQDHLRFHEIENEIVRLTPQYKLTRVTGKLDEEIATQYEAALKEGGEGLIFHHHTSWYEPRRSRHMLKYKPFQDDEATVTGYVWGRETDKGSKLLGKMGALIVDYLGHRLELSGFTDEERELVLVDTSFMYEKSEMSQSSMLDYLGREYAGKDVNAQLVQSQQFPLGSIVTFRFRELSDTGIPKEARYLRRPHGHIE